MTGVEDLQVNSEMATERVLTVKGIAVVLAVILLIVGCRRHSGAWQTMDTAESVMEERPDSALAILEDIDERELSGAEEQARLALLMSMALDKNYIDTTNFDVLQPAIDYYLKKGSADEKRKTYYYQGRIFQNLGDDESAMQSFMNAADINEDTGDPMLLARNYVALGTLYYMQYKIDDFIESNLRAAHLYEIAGKDKLQIRSYVKAIDGYMMLNDKAGADSIRLLCNQLVKGNDDIREELLSSDLSYTIEYGTEEEIKALLKESLVSDLNRDNALDVAYGYVKIGESGKAMEIVSCISPEGSVFDSLKYLTIKSIIAERQGDYEEALTLYKEYSAMHERYQKHLLSQDLLFSEEKHQLELTNIIKLQKRDHVILCVVLGLLVLLLLAGWLYYRYRIARSKRLMAEKENENLLHVQKELNMKKETAENENAKLRHDHNNLLREKKEVELERDKIALDAQNMDLERQSLKAEQSRQELLLRNLCLEKRQLEEERDNLKKLLEDQSELSKSVRKIITARLDLLNGLLAKEISNDDTYAKQYIESIRNDKDKFLKSTRQTISALNPRFIKYLKNHELTEAEINYLCLYAIGLRGKDVGRYLELKRHYNISSEIRKKLGLDEHDTNIGIYVRKLLNVL